MLRTTSYTHQTISPMPQAAADAAMSAHPLRNRPTERLAVHAQAAAAMNAATADPTSSTAMAKRSPPRLKPRMRTSPIAKAVTAADAKGEVVPPESSAGGHDHQTAIANMGSWLTWSTTPSRPNKPMFRWSVVRAERSPSEQMSNSPRSL